MYRAMAPDDDVSPGSKPRSGFRAAFRWPGWRSKDKPKEGGGSNKLTSDSTSVTELGSIAMPHSTIKPQTKSSGPCEIDKEKHEAAAIVAGHSATGFPDSTTKSLRKSTTSARSELWSSAYSALREEKPELAQDFESFIKAENDLPKDMDVFEPAAIAAIVSSQKYRMESKQWKYSWSDKSVKVRDTVEGILSTVQSASPIVSQGLSFAPPYVTIPWTFISLIIPFAMRDFSEMHSALDGLKEVTCILSSYNLAEEEFLARDVTKTDFQNSVLNLYKLIFEYQAQAAQYFAASTLRRLGRNIRPGTTWQDALAAVKKAEALCHIPVNALAVRLQQSDFSSLERLLAENTSFLKRSIDEASATRTRNRQVVEWLSIINAVQDHADARARLGEEYFGSGQWLFKENESFVTWQHDPSGKLLIQGFVGTGKSCLVSIVVEHLLGHASGRLAFHYCSAEKAVSNSMTAAHNDTTVIFRSILAQLAVLEDGTIAEPVLEAFRSNSLQGPGESNLSLRATIELLRDVLACRNDQVTLVIDALDELQDHVDFLDTLKIIQTYKKTVRILFSSRFGIDMEHHFPEIVALPISSWTANDISVYIDNEISKRASRSGISTRQADRLGAALKKWSDGVFRWVVLEIDIFLPRTRFRFQSTDYEARLNRLERSRAPAVDRLFLAYDQMYIDALGGKDELSRRHIVDATIKWVLCSFRSFTVGELASVISLSLHAARMSSVGAQCEEAARDNNSSDEFDNVEHISKEDILGYCANFITQTPKGMVKLAHLSVRHFFEDWKRPQFAAERQHLEAATTSISGILGTKGNFPLSTNDYYKRSWAIHSRSATETPKLMEFLESKELREHPCVTKLEIAIASKADLMQKDLLGNSILHQAVSLGECHQVDLIVSMYTLSGQDCPFLKTRNHNGDSPLHIAASHGYEGIFRRLLLAGASVEETNSFGLSPLHMAVLFGEENVIYAAWQLGVSLNVLDGAHGTLLHTAALCDNLQISLMLTQSAINFDHKNQDGRTALEVAKMHDAIDVTDLLRSPVDGPSTSKLPPMTYKASGPDYEENFDSGIKQQAPTRPKVYIDTPVACKLCDLEEWMEGSRHGLMYMHCPSKDLLEASAKRCVLCSHFLEVVESVEDEQRPINDPAAKQSDISVKVTLAADSTARGSARDLLSIYLGQILAGQFEFALDESVATQSAPLSVFSGRSIAGYETSLPFIKEWLRTCVEEHAHCKPFRPVPLPGLMLEIQGEKSVKLVEGQDLAADSRYVFFSWTYGQAPVPKTTSTNRSSFLTDGIPWDLFLPLFRDVFTICRSIGYRYIFTDCFCVEQNSATYPDELRLLSDYTVGADLVIAATGSGGWQKLFEDNAPQKLQPVARVNAHIGDSSTLVALEIRKPLEPVKEIMYREVLSRSWRAQETLLAQRLLVLDQHQPIWNCGDCLRTPASALSLPPVIMNTNRLWNISCQLSEQEYPSSDITEARDSKGDFAAAMRRRLCAQWYKYVELITNGRSPSPFDRFPSAMGVMREVDRMFSSMFDAKSHESLESRQAGLYTREVHRGLLWIVKYSEGTIATKQREYLGPSWSWVSLTARISYRLSCIAALRHGNSICDLELIDASTCINVQHHILSGWMQIRGYIRSIPSVKSLSKFDLLFDTRNAKSDWLVGGNLFLLVVTRLTYTASETDQRWVGLVLKETEELPFEDKLPSSIVEQSAGCYYSRVGVFLGPDCRDLPLPNDMHWAQKVIVLV